MTEYNNQLREAMGVVTGEMRQDFFPPIDDPTTFKTGEDYFSSESFQNWLKDEEKQKKWKNYQKGKQ